MLKLGILVLASVEGPGDLGRVVNALETAKEFGEAGDQVEVVFDGAGSKWVPALSDPGHRYHRLFDSVRNSVTGVCAYCARAYKVADQVEAAGFSLLDEFDHHPSVRRLVAEGYQVITF